MYMIAHTHPEYAHTHLFLSVSTYAKKSYVYNLCLGGYLVRDCLWHVYVMRMWLWRVMIESHLGGKLFSLIQKYLTRYLMYHIILFLLCFTLHVLYGISNHEIVCCAVCQRYKSNFKFIYEELLNSNGSYTKTRILNM